MEFSLQEHGFRFRAALRQIKFVAAALAAEGEPADEEKKVVEDAAAGSSLDGRL